MKKRQSRKPVVAAARKKPAVKKDPHRLLFDLAVALGAVREINEGLRLCLESALSVSGMECGGIYLADESTGGLDLAVHRGLSREFVASTSHYEAASPNTRLVNAGQPVYQLFRKTALPQNTIHAREGLRALAIVPIRYDGRVIGCLNIASRRRSVTGPVARRGLIAVAGEIGGAVSRLKAEAALRESQSRYQQLLEATSDAVFVLDHELRFGVVNRAGLRFLGLSAADITGKRLDEVYPAARQSLLDELKTALEKRKPTALSGPFDLGGRKGWYEVIVDPVPDGCLCLLRDITERKQAETQLHESEKRFSLAFMTSPYAYMIADMEDGAIIEVNDAFSAISGFTREEALSSSTLKLNLWVNKADRERMIVALRENGVVERMETQLRTKSGDIGTALLFARLIRLGPRACILSIIEDITERKRAEDAVKKSEERYRRLIETTNTGYVIIDRNGAVLDANEEYVRLSGHDDLGEILGRSVVEWTADEEKEANAQAVAACLKNGFLRNYRVVYIGRKGKRTPIEINATTIETEGELKILTLCRDITAVWEAEAAVRRNEAHYRSLYNAVSDALFVHEVNPDGSGLRFVEANDIACRLLGYTREEFLSLTPSDLDAPGTGIDFASINRRIMAGETVEFEHEILAQDGRRIPVEIRIQLFSLSARPAMLSLVRDVTERRRAGRAIVENEARFRSLFETTQDSIFIIDRSTGDIVAANPAAGRLYGYTALEFQALKNTDLSAEPEKTSRAVKAGVAQVPLRYHRKKDGTLFPVEITGGYFELDGRRLHTAFIRDISERLRAEQALVESEDKFRYIFNHSVIGKSITHPTGAVHVNRAFCDMLGYTEAEMENRSWQSVTHPDDITLSQRAIDALLAGEGEPLRFTKRFLHKNGSVVWAEVTSALRRNRDGAPLYFITSVIDITERKRTETALLQSEQRFRALIENSSDAISLIGADGAVVYDSPSYARIMGYPGEDRLGKNTLDLIHPDDRAVVRDLLEGIVRQPGRVDLPPVRVRHSGGAWLWIEGVAQNFLADPAVSAIIINFRDITERRRAEEALRASEARFRDLAELLPQTIFETDAAGTITYVNRNGYAMFNYSVEEVRRGVKLFEAIAPADRDRLRALVAGILQGQLTAGTEYVALRRDGSTFPALSYSLPIVSDGQIRGLRGLVVDISAQKSIEKELADTRAILETAFAETPIPMVVASAADASVRMANHAVLEFLGIEDEANPIGASLFGLRQSWRDFDARGNQLAIADMPLGRALRGEATKNELYYVRRKDGTIRWELVSASPIRDPSGALIAAFAVFPDVTERMNTEEELKRQLGVEQLAAEVSAEFVNVAFNDIDAAIRSALKKTTLYADARSASLFMVSEDLSTVTNTHEWCVAPEESQLAPGSGRPAGLRDFHIASLNRNQPVIVSRPSDFAGGLAGEEDEERAVADAFGFRPQLVAPLFRSGKLIGAFGVYGSPGGELNWPAQLVTLLGLIGDMIVNLLDRKQAEAELHLYREHLEELVADRTEELERSRTAAIKLMETATIQRQRAEDALQAATRMAEALRESQTRLRLATSSAQIGIVETDLAAGELAWDDTCAAIHGLPPGQSVRLDRYLNEIVHPADRAAVRASLEESLSASADHWGREYRILRPNGDARWITEDHFILRGPEGNAVRLIGAKQDVTVRKEAEEQIRRALAEKETLIREIHHRVKNNLNTISNLIYFQTKLLKDKQAISAFRDSQNRIQSMARIHEHLYRSWDLARVDMKAYLADLVVDLSQTYGVTSARLELDAADLALDIDQAVPCGLIMNELVSNAVKYAFTAGATDNRITIRIAPAGAAVVLEVADNGSGLPPGWDPARVDSLGIRLVNMFCKQLAGELTVKSAPGAGTTFRIEFRRTKEERTI